MGVPMVQVGIVRMLMAHRLVTVPVGMRPGDFAFVGMFVVFIMNVPVLVFELQMRVLMLVPFGQMKPSAEGDEKPGNKNDGGQRRAKNDGRRQGANKWGSAVVRAGAGRAKMAKRHDKKDQPKSVAYKPQRHGTCEIPEFRPMRPGIYGKNRVDAACRQALHGGKHKRVRC